ncbi:hypothetical protein DICVIV_09448 [Dictyocaulus viviparus]|uniref:Essential MCU regulator, mitochondrial n=1 Tax=Dictyocaulus viviparus TaxID=29172 RepID=A0A0D8XL84_DICVI|nr:hypothetical protein DICVIV_09448 [Dictyocaulus viviparus]
MGIYRALLPNFLADSSSMVVKTATKSLIRILFQSVASTTLHPGSVTSLMLEKLIVPYRQCADNSIVRGIGLQPARNRGALFKASSIQCYLLCLVAASSLYAGGFLAHKAASYLEENEIFVPSDDDDDD